MQLTRANQSAAFPVVTWSGTCKIRWCIDSAQQLRPFIYNGYVLYCNGGPGFTMSIVQWEEWKTPNAAYRRKHPRQRYYEGGELV